MLIGGLYIDMKAELKERLDRTVETFLYEWEERHSKFPDYLWHYTSIAGVKGILTEHSLWFSDATFLNDSSELSYAVDVAEKVIKQKVEKEQLTPLVQEQLQAFLLESAVTGRVGKHLALSNQPSWPAFVKKAIHYICGGHIQEMVVAIQLVSFQR